MSWEKLSIAVIFVILIVVGIVAFRMFTSQEPVKIESVEKAGESPAGETEPVTEIVGGTTPRCMASIASTSSTPPLAPNRWPSWLLVLEMATFGACSLKTVLTAVVSA